MPLEKMPNNIEDLSDGNGFQFRIYCELCNDGVKTKRIKAKSPAKGRRRGFMADVLGAVGLSRASSVMSATENLAEGGYEEEHERAQKAAVVESKDLFKKCPSCKQYVCKDCWNAKKKKCSECASA